MTNQQKTDDEGDSLAPGGTEPTDAVETPPDPVPPHDPSPDPETIDPARVEAVGPGDAMPSGPSPEREGGVSKIAGVLLIVLLTLVAAGLGAALGPLIHPTAGTDATGALAGRLDALEARLGTAGAATEDLAMLRDQVVDLEQRVGTLEAAPAAAGTGPADIDRKLGELETALATLAARVDGALGESLAAIDPDLAAGTPSSDTDGSSSLAAEVADLQQSVSALDAGTADRERVAELASRVDALDRRLGEVAAMAGTLDALRQEVAALQSRATDPRAAFALATGQLREAVLAGDAYAEPLATAEGLAPDDTEVSRALAALAPWQQEGVPTRARLADALDAAAYEAVDAARQDAAQGWFDKTVAELAAIVSIRRVDGEAGGTGADDVTARAEARLRQGDLQGAIEEMATLQGAAAEAASGWLEMARARLASEAAVTTLSARALALLEGGA